jgi:hypothetical protein
MKFFNWLKEFGIILLILAVGALLFYWGNSIAPTADNFESYGGDDPEVMAVLATFVAVPGVFIFLAGACAISLLGISTIFSFCQWFGGFAKRIIGRA